MLRVKNLSFANRLTALSVHFSPGEIHAILGPNGAGKTTFFKTLKRIWTKTEGKITWNGEETDALTIWELSRLFSLVPQNPPIAFPFTVEEFVAMGNYKKNRSQKTLLESLSLGHLAKKSILEISGGELKRAYIARSLAAETPVLLLDEPLSSLDPGHQKRIWRKLEKLAASGKTIILSLHDIAAAKEHCHKASLINRGRLVATGNPKEVLQETLLETVFNGS